VNPERWERIEWLYHEALDREPIAREAFLDQACAGDEAMRSEISSLLAHDEMADDFIESPALVVAAREMASNLVTADPTQLPSSIATPTQLGSYEVESPLGRGGMGEVYLARDAKLGRKVAVKLLPVQFTADPERVRRFTQEARTVSSLNHPNILTIHEIGDAPAKFGSRRYIVTEYVEGETLRQFMDRASGENPSPGIELLKAIDVARQIAAALAAAHDAGITHRDIKPENVMLRRDGLIKVLDFGLAKLDRMRNAEAEDLPTDGSELPHSALHIPHSTEAGLVLGTPRYMSPEQAGGERVDARTDIFSLGVVLYEMIAGRPPFEGATPSKIIAAILRDDPPPLLSINGKTPQEIERILTQALCKDREGRYQTIEAMSSDLDQLRKFLEQEDKLNEARDPTHQPASPNGANGPLKLRPSVDSSRGILTSLRSNHIFVAGALALALLGAGWFGWRSIARSKARALIPQIETLANAERYFEAYDLALEAQKRLPNDPAINRLMAVIADDLSVASDPPGAEVYLKLFAPDGSGQSPDRQLIGVTPISHRQIGRGAYVLSIEKQGYAHFERSVTGLMLKLSGVQAPSPPISVEAKLTESAKTPPGMVFVPAGSEFRLSSWGRPTDKSARIDDFFIDRFEVSNREYKEFISAGGYQKREYWRSPIIKGGRELTWEEAIREFKDHTSLPGPRNWTNQAFPEGKADHPVTDISWYEAAAYAAFRGKSLPTIFQWEKAARGEMPGRGRGRPSYFMMPWGPFTGSIESRANYNSQGTMPVQSLNFGISPYGCFHMAGNVAEWCLNEAPEGFTIAGGSWNDPAYLFGAFGAFPGAFCANKLGFRCVLNPPGGTGDQGGMPLSDLATAPNYKPVSDARFQSWQELYRYAQPPLDPRIEETVETDDWKMQKITYAGAGGERAMAYLYLPRQYSPPWQVIQFMPGDDVFVGFRPLRTRVEGSLTQFVKSGRAVLAVALKGFPERELPANFSAPADETIEYRDLVFNWTIDQRRALDYVETRPDLDPGKIAFFGFSGGESRKIVLPAIEPRYRSAILIGAGIRPSVSRVLPEINPVNLLPQIRAPKLVINGRYDEVMSLKNDCEPFHHLLREPKKILVVETGHIPPPEVYVAPVNQFLDQTLGPVRRQ
jgi:serine/threonine protein kinase/formylglycine-generating enzyme required for sulfatase activity